MWLLIIIFLSLIVPNIFLIRFLRKSESAEDPTWWGLLSGALPMLIAALWFLYFIIRYHKSYHFDEMQLMEGFILMVFALVPILVPSYANLLWKYSTQPLMVKRLLLFLGLFVLYILYFQMPLSWNFTFVLFPLFPLIMTVGFLFLRRRPAPSPSLKNLP